MLNNDVRLIGVALSNYEIDGKLATFQLEIEKQKSGSTYTVELKAFTNSKTIKFEEKIKGKLLAIQGFLDDKNTVVATNVIVLTVRAATVESTPAVEVVTSKDLENNIVIDEDDLPF